MSLSNGRARALWRAAAVFLAAALVAAAPSAQVESAPEVARWVEAREVAERAHLARVGVWGGTALLGGATLFLLSDAAGGRRAFGMQTAAWGAVNVAIAGVALSRASSGGPTDLAGALGAEGRLADILWLNEGLNVGYVAVGATLYAVGARAGVGRADEWRGHGAAVMVQGLGLLVLDGIALAGSGGRRDALLGLLGSVTLVPTAGGLGLIVAL